MNAVIKGITVTGTPEEIMALIRANEAQYKPTLKGSYHFPGTQSVGDAMEGISRLSRLPRPIANPARVR